MPLVVFCGHPCSGKTTRANELIHFLNKSQIPSKSSSEADINSQSFDICLLNHETLSLSRSLYRNPLLEKKLRAEFKSAVERKLTQNRVVVLDYLDSIKGYRYELFCRSKESATKHCVVYIQTDIEQCRKWHDKRKFDQLNEQLSDQYEDAYFNDLSNRMEFPNEKNRWDSPLFTIKAEMTDEERTKVYDGIRKFLVTGKSHRASIATMTQKTESSEFLFELDRITLNCIHRLLKLQNSQQIMMGDKVPISDEFSDVKIEFNRKVTLSELKRIQSQYMSICRIRPPKANRDIVVQFAQHLSTALSRE